MLSGGTCFPRRHALLVSLEAARSKGIWKGNLGNVHHVYRIIADTVPSGYTGVAEGFGNRRDPVEAKASAEAAKGRARTKENDIQHHTYWTQSGMCVSRGLGV
jgi:hypothetical protein